MRFEISIANKSFEEQVWAELETLSSQLIGDMKLVKGRRRFDDNGPFIIVLLEEITDTAALMQTLAELANKGIQWSLNTEWWWVNETSSSV